MTIINRLVIVRLHATLSQLQWIVYCKVIVDFQTSTTSTAKSKIAKTDEEPALTNGDAHSAGDLKISTIPKFKVSSFDNPVVAFVIYILHF